jgi:mannose-6-phosphate isomerase-like protein (cupin superfamily)
VSSGYRILSLDDLPAYESPSHGDARLMPLRGTLGLRAFGANCWTADPGKQIVPTHEEDGGNEELYVVVRGRARFTVGEETFDAPAGTLVHVRAETTREAFAEEAGTIVLAVGATPGSAFEAHGWDDFVVAFAEGRAGNVDRGRAIMQEVAARHPDHWGPVYNLACFEARVGDHDAAIDHLRRAKRMGPDEVRGYLQHDTDLDPLRDDPRFQELAG